MPTVVVGVGPRGHTFLRSYPKGCVVFLSCLCGSATSSAILFRLLGESKNIPIPLGEPVLSGLQRTLQFALTNAGRDQGLLQIQHRNDST